MKTLPFHLPDIGNNEINSVLEVLRSGWLTTGAKTHEFEAEFAEAVGADFAVAVNSCTAALHLSLEAIGLKEGDEVITTPYTFASTAEVVEYFNAKPVFVDVNEDDLNINSYKIESIINEKTKAILPVHMAGKAVNLEHVYDIANKYDLFVVEDAAHSFPTTYNGQFIGGHSKMREIPSTACFSFYATKTITTGEGGMICTHDAKIADRCKRMALHGISKNAWNRYSSTGSWFYEIESPGFKYNMTDMAAALGLCQLQKAESMRDRRLEIATLYNEAFSNIEQFRVPPLNIASNDLHSWHLYMLRINPNTLKISRDHFIQQLRELGIGTSVHFIPLHIHPYYKDKYGYNNNDFPVAFNEFQKEISLPIYSSLSDSDIERIIECVIKISKDHAK